MRAVGFCCWLGVFIFCLASDQERGAKLKKLVGCSKLVPPAKAGNLITQKGILMENTNTLGQTYLLHTFVIGDGDFTDVVCQECAEKFAEEHGLEWRGGQSYNSFTEELEGSSAHAGDTPSYARGESDYPYGCCGYYLQTGFTEEGQDYLKSEFPKWVQELYGY